MSSNQRGFTIIELLIATAVFSVILLLITLSLFDITRIYYKGITNSKTQEAARTIMQDVSQAIQFSGGEINSNIVAVPGTSVHCVGSRRYSFKRNQKVEDGPPVAVHGLVVDEGGVCINTVAQNFGALDPDDTELLSSEMSVTDFRIEPVGSASSRLYKVTVRVAYGDPGGDLLIDDVKADGSAGSDGVYDKCASQRIGAHFCAISELSTVVQQRVK